MDLFTKNLVKKVVGESCKFETLADAKECAGIMDVVIKLQHNYILIESYRRNVIPFLLQAGFVIIY